MYSASTASRCRWFRIRADGQPGVDRSTSRRPGAGANAGSWQGYQPVQPQPRGQQANQRGDHRPVRPIEARFRVASAQHGDLVAQHQQLDVLGRRRTPEQHQQAHKPEEDQIEQTQPHGRRSCPALHLSIAAGRAWTEFWNPQVLRRMSDTPAWLDRKLNRLVRVPQMVHNATST